MVNSGFQDPKTTWNVFKTRENFTTPQLVSPHGLGLNWAKNCYRTGERTPKGQMVPISRAHTARKVTCGFCTGTVAQLLAGTDAGTWVRSHVRVWGGGFCCSVPQYRRGRGESGATHRNTQERTRECCTYPLATYPFKSARVPRAPLSPPQALGTTRGAHLGEEHVK